MGKITANQYLFKKKEYNHNGKAFYPVYVRVIVNQKVTDIKSLTGYFMTETGFDLYTRGIENNREQIRGSYKLPDFATESGLINRTIQQVENATGEPYSRANRDLKEDVTTCWIVENTPGITEQQKQEYLKHLILRAYKAKI